MADRPNLRPESQGFSDSGAYTMNSPAPITFYCVHCGTKLLVPVELAGETGPCPQCTAVITAPLVSSLGPQPQPPLQVPGIGGQRLPGAEPVPSGAGQERHLPADLVAQALDPLLQDFVRPSVPARGYEPTHQEPVVAPRPVAQGRRQASRDPSEFSVELAEHGYGETESRRAFPVALVTLLLVVASGAGYLSWRMGLWETMEATLAEAVATPPQVAQAENVPITPTAQPVASLVQPPTPASREKALPERRATPVSEPIPLAEPYPIVSARSPGGTEATRSKAADVETPPPGPALPPVDAPPSTPSSTKVSMAEASPAAAGAAPAPVEAAITPSSDPRDRARNVVRKFLEAQSWKDRVGLVDASGDPGAALSAYYQSHPDLPISNYRLDFFHNEPRPGDTGSAYIFFLTFPDETDGFPVMVMENQGEFRLDWDLYLEFREKAFQRFVEDAPEKAASFRLVLQRVTYWEPDRDQIPNVDQLLCYKIDPPYPGFTRYAFVDRETEVGKQLGKELSWESDPLAAEVQLKWSEFPGGKRYLTIDRLVARSWVRPISPELPQSSVTAKN